MVSIYPSHLLLIDSGNFGLVFTLKRKELTKPSGFEKLLWKKINKNKPIITEKKP